MGDVYRAHDSRLNRDVAIKVLPDDVRDDPERRERFLREAEAVAGLNHPHICVLHDIGEHDGAKFLVMEYLEGETLSARLAAGALRPEEAIRYGIEIADALATAHERGVVHRDLKPGNVMLTAAGAKLLDFGLAKPVPRRDSGDAPTHLEAITAEGSVLGTLQYMAPEQVTGKDTDERTDAFSFGVVLYEMLTGTHPFSRGSQAETVSAILKEDPAPIASSAMTSNARLATLIRRLLAKRGEDRPASMRTVGEELRAVEQALAGRGGDAARPARSRLIVGLGLAAAVLVGVFGLRYANQVRMIRWATAEALPEARRLAESGDVLAAFDVAVEAERFIPDNPILVELLSGVSRSIEIATEPDGADVYYRDPLRPDAPWVHAGRTPFSASRFPNALVRWRLEKAGFETVEGLGQTPPALALDPEGVPPGGMIRVPAGSVGWHALINLGGLPNTSVPLGEFFISRYEVTNVEFKAFVDQGGYANPQYWKHEFVVDGGVLSWRDGTTRLVDATGMPGPSTWRLGTYPEGEGALPVGGVSWYEAAAYAEFAGASLPTVFHWTRAAGTPVADQNRATQQSAGRGP